MPSGAGPGDNVLFFACWNESTEHRRFGGLFESAARSQRIVVTARTIAAAIAPTAIHVSAPRGAEMVVRPLVSGAGSSITSYRMESRTSCNTLSMAVTRMKPRRGYSMSMIT